MSPPLSPRRQSGKQGHTGPLTVFRVISPDDHVRPGSDYTRTDELMFPEIGRVTADSTELFTTSTTP